MKLNYIVLTVLAVDLLATAGDIMLSWTSPMYPKLYSNDTSINPLGRSITEGEDAWIGSLLNIAGAVGAFPFNFIAKRFGRKIGLLSVALPIVISFFTLAVAKHIYLFYLARILGGLAIGGGYALLPMYIAEISKASNRGAMSQTLSIFWAIGNFLPYAIGPFFSVLNFNLILACIPTLFFLVFLTLGLESPYYLVSVNKLSQAEETLAKLRNSTKEEVQEELYYIKSHVKMDENGSFLDIINSKVLLKVFLMCLILVMTQELSGFCAIMYHLETIFEAAGTKIASDVSSVIVGFAVIVSSLISPLLIDRTGRKLLIVCSCFGMSIALTLLGIFFYAQDWNINTKPIFWLPIFSLILYIFSFNFGICCVPWTIISEIFPNHIKHVAASTIASITWLTSFCILNLYNAMNDKLGMSGTFWIFGFLSLCTAIYSWIVIPETKGKSFTEIQTMLHYKDVKKKNMNENEMIPLGIHIKR